MQIQVNTDNNITGDEILAQRVEEILHHALERFAGQITRLEVHLSDENSTSKSGIKDKRCLLEARIAGRDPTSASDVAETVALAVTGAAQKMVSQLARDRGKLATH